MPLIGKFRSHSFRTKHTASPKSFRFPKLSSRRFIFFPFKYGTVEPRLSGQFRRQSSLEDK